MSEGAKSQPEAENEKSGAEDPAKSGADDPAKSGVVDPAKSGVVDPAKSGAADPAKSGAADPAKSGAADPAKSAAVDPAKSAAVDQAKSAAVDPAKSGSKGAGAGMAKSGVAKTGDGIKEGASMAKSGAPAAEGVSKAGTSKLSKSGIDGKTPIKEEEEEKKDGEGDKKASVKATIKINITKNTTKTGAGKGHKYVSLKFSAQNPNWTVVETAQIDDSDQMQQKLEGKGPISVATVQEMKSKGFSVDTRNGHDNMFNGEANGQPQLVKLINLTIVTPRFKANLQAYSIKILKYIGEKPLCKEFPKVTEVFLVGDKIYCIFMEPLQNIRSLYDLMINKEEIPLESCQRWARQLTQGVCVLQKFGVAHRFLKLKHLFIEDNNLKILGWSKAVLFYNASKNKALLQQKEKRIRKNNYLPPEAFDQLYYDPSCADVWAIGVVLVAMLTRRYPFHARAKIKYSSQWRMFLEKHFMDPVPRSLLNLIFVIDPKRRIKAGDILRHPFFHMSTAKMAPSRMLNEVEKTQVPNMIYAPLEVSLPKSQKMASSKKAGSSKKEGSKKEGSKKTGASKKEPSKKEGSKKEPSKKSKNDQTVMGSGKPAAYDGMSSKMKKLKKTTVLESCDKSVLTQNISASVIGQSKLNSGLQRGLYSTSSKPINTIDAKMIQEYIDENGSPVKEEEDEAQSPEEKNAKEEAAECAVPKEIPVTAEISKTMHQAVTALKEVEAENKTNPDAAAAAPEAKTKSGGKVPDAGSGGKSKAPDAISGGKSKAPDAVSGGNSKGGEANPEATAKSVPNAATDPAAEGKENEKTDGGGEGGE